MNTSEVRANEIIFPPHSKNGMLWRWVEGEGLWGPFCPVHRRVSLYYWPSFGSSRANFKEDEWLSGNGSFVCPIDEKEEFIIIRPSAIKIGQLRRQAEDRLRSEFEHSKTEEQ